MEREFWKAVVLRLPHELAESFIGRLAGRTTGVESTPAGERDILLKLFLLPEQAAEAMEEATRFIVDSGLGRQHCGLHLEIVEDGHWVEKFQAKLKPFALGQRFTVYPAGEPAGGSSRIPLLLVPGRAFGTGEHPTTRLCAERLERLVLAGGRWLDLGCGTAVLAIVAHHCGAGEVVAIDDDPEAIDVAAAVLAANGLAGKIAIECRTLEHGAEERFDGIVANISQPFLVEHARALADALDADGRLVCSGFLENDREEVEGALARAGLEITGRDSSAGWSVVVATRTAGSQR